MTRFSAVLAVLAVSLFSQLSLAQVSEPEAVEIGVQTPSGEEYEITPVVFEAREDGSLHARPLNRDGDIEISLQTLMTLGIQFNSAQILTGQLGVVIGKRSGGGGYFSNEETAGLLIEVDPGVRGGMLSAGYSDVSKGLGTPGGAGFDVRGIVYRSWLSRDQGAFGIKSSDDPGNVYAGIGADAFYLLKVSVGALVRTSSRERKGRDFIFLFGLGGQIGL